MLELYFATVKLGHVQKELRDRLIKVSCEEMVCSPSKIFVFLGFFTI